VRAPVRVVGVDLGERRIGVAVSDSAARVATPYEVVERRGDRGAEHADIARIVQEVGALRVVVGLPLSMDGTEGPAARSARYEAAELAGRLPVGVELHDERLSTVQATRSMRQAGAGTRARRRRVDPVAAAVMLQSWLDRESA
jgi:putative Holliday junction resolvase